MSRRTRHALVPLLAPLLAAVSLLASCDVHPVAPGVAPRPAPLVRVESDWVTGAAAAAVGYDGAFVFPPPPYRITSPLRADSLALAELHYMQRTYGVEPRLASGWLYGDYDRVIRLAELGLCARRSYYVRSAFASLPPSLSDNLRRSYAPQYAVPLCRSDGAGELAVEVADEAGTSNVSNGEFVPPSSAGAGIGVVATTFLGERGLPLSPEQAVKALALAGGPPIDMVPMAELVYPGNSIFSRDKAPCMRWHLRLAQSTTVRTTDGTLEQVRDVYVTRAVACNAGDPVIQAADVTQPGSFTTYFSTPNPDGSATGSSVSIALSLPIRFHPVTFVR